MPAAAASESLSRARSKEGRVPPPHPPRELGTDAGMGTGTGESWLGWRCAQMRGWLNCGHAPSPIVLQPAPQPANGTATASSDPQRLG